jgi:selenocysteine lyase/cysteine desulfurase
VCSNVLFADCCWAAYQSELCDAAARVNRNVTGVNVRDAILSDQVGPEEVIRLVVQRYEHSQCDGLFLPAVDNLGVRLPIREIVAACEAIRKPRFVLVDGAQALGHLSNIDCHDVCDIFLAGCHKWLRAYLPLGIAIFGKARSREWIQHALAGREFIDSVDDPLLRFTRELETDSAGRFSETVNITPLFTCRAAIADALSDQNTRHDRWKDQLSNAEEVRKIADLTSWRVRSPASSMRTGILLLDRNDRCGDTMNAGAIRKALADHKITVSTYETGTIRLSMPQRPLLADELEQLANTLARIAKRADHRVKTKTNRGSIHARASFLPIVPR